ncbi:spore protease YyaC [Brevibacillus brevis]|uniref:Spore protease YyaC n=1 Tax=Brevibacillus brevis TaxID=1393 RepID=A0ABY9TDL3_BREBE|nr:spore protease YyaC [Brevibacillus brevis]WNC17654.1 spore protease YyaC [Brevibacillus brevis]
MLHYCHYLEKKSVAYLADALIQHYTAHPDYTEIVVVCIGTNRYTGDSLGPIVGSQLLEKLKGQRRVHIYGTLENPVHALNLQKTLSLISQKHGRAYVIAVDACLGQFYKIGTLQVVEEPLQPGVSLDKQLPPIGHIHIKGIINNYGPLNHKVLEHTSLTFVQEMAGVIARILERVAQAIVPQLADEQALPRDSNSQATR